MHHCIYCSTGYCIKKCVRNGKQRYQCKGCGKYQLRAYTYKLYNEIDDKSIIFLNAESMGISSLSRYLGYSKQTILKRIEYLGSKVKKPVLIEYNQVYEVDEMWTYVSSCRERDVKWITYAINRKTNQVVDVVIGARTKENLAKLIDKLKRLSPKKIVTDKLQIYPDLISPIDHDTRRYRNNKIERNNLNLRTHIKRLSRKTICYSKSEKMLTYSVLLYFSWNNWQIKMK